MKTKTMMMTLLGGLLLLTACGSGSKTIEVKDAKVEVGTSAPRYALVGNAISVVPGQYEMTWAKSKEYSEGFTQFNVTLKVRLEQKIDVTSDDMLQKEVMGTLGGMLLKVKPLDIDGRDFTGNTNIVWIMGKTFNDKDEDILKLRELLTNSEVGTVVEINFFCMPTTESDRNLVIEKTEQIQLYVGV